MAWRHPARGKDAGSTSAIGLSVAAATFAIAFVTANVMVTQPAGTDHRSASLETAASTALEVIIGQSGSAASGGSWVAHPDSIGRFGLAADATPNFLDYQKIRLMRNASTASATNLAPDYPDVRAALGLAGGDFHLRTYPVIPGYDDPRWTKEPQGRLAYVGHIDSAQGIANMVPYANTSGNYLNVSLAIRNDGSQAMVFVANVGLGNLATNTLIKYEQRHTRLLLPGDVQTITVSYPKMAYSPAVTGANVQLADGYGGVIIEPYWIAATAPGGSNVNWMPLLSAGDIYYTSGETVNFQADHMKGDGTRMNSAQSGRFVLVGPNGKEWVNTTTGITLPKNKPLTWSCSNCTVVGNYTATLWDTTSLPAAGGARRVIDTVHVSAAKMFKQTEALSPLATREIAYLKDLVVNFNGLEHDDVTVPEGDVFTDAAHIRDLDEILDRYTILVVGSEVRQNSLNSGQTKWAIADWVQAGGNLIVLGTLDSQSNWLDPVYHAAQQTANGGIGAPDPTHPILKAPNQIDYRRYLDNARAWRIKDDQPFTHVLTRGVTGNGQDDTLAVAAPGAYNDGTVVLTSYMAGALTSPQDDAEAKRFMHNLLSQGYTMLFLDYGPPVPSATPVGTAQRLVAVPHPNVPGAVVETRIVMYNWD